jgi:protein SCO1/2
VRDRRLALGLVGILLLALVTACGGDSKPASGIAVSKPGNHGFNGVYLDQPYELASVELRSDRGEAVDLAKLPGLNLVFFGYTNCPDVCQTVMSTIASALTRLPEADQDRIRVNFVTTDPARDTPEQLREYLDRFNPAFVGVTGSMADLVASAKPLGIEIEKGQKLPGGGYDVDHGTHTFAVRDGQSQVLWTAATSPAEMAADLKRLVKGDS